MIVNRLCRRMAPNITSAPTGVLFEGETLAEPQLIEESKEKPKYVRRIVWRNVVIFSYLHLGALYGVYLAFTSAKLATIVFGEWFMSDSFPLCGVYSLLHKIIMWYNNVLLNIEIKLWNIKILYIMFIVHHSLRLSSVDIIALIYSSIIDSIWFYIYAKLLA